MPKLLAYLAGAIASIAIWVAVLWAVFTYFAPATRITP